MMDLSALNKKKVKEILALIDKQFSCAPDFDNFAFFLTEKNKIYMIRRGFEDIGLDRLRINSLGVYFCELAHDEIRLSIEGSQIIGPIAKKGVIEIDEAQSKRWLSGEDLDMGSAGKTKGFVIVKSGRDYMGCGKIKDGRLLNYVPKIRRMSTII